jgi:hypothetical protein
MRQQVGNTTTTLSFSLSLSLYSAGNATVGLLVAQTSKMNNRIDSSGNGTDHWCLIMMKSSDFGGLEN